MQMEKTKNVPYLDGWRGIAIICVLIGHFAQPVGPFRTVYFGALGVMLFFVLSGFFMGKILYVKKVRLKIFFARRAIRIVPTMWVYITAAYFFSRYFQVDSYAVPLNELVPTYFFLSTYLPPTVSLWSNLWPNGHLWSLNVEEHCYIYLALGTLLISKTKENLSKSLFLLGSVGIIFLTTALYSRGIIRSAVASPFSSHTEVAALGLIASAAYVGLNLKNKAGQWSNSPWVPVLALLVAAILFIPAHSRMVDLTMLISPVLAAIAVNHAEDFPISIKEILSSKILTWFGTCSFSLYLWQQPFYLLCHNNGYSHIYGAILSIAIGRLSYYVLENPTRKYLTRKLNNYEQLLAERRSALA